LGLEQKSTSQVMSTESLVSTIKKGFWGYLGQALALLSLFMPALAGHEDLLPNLVFVSGISAILIPTTTLAAQVRLPLVASDEVRRNAGRVITTISITVVGLASFGVWSMQISAEVSELSFSLAIMHLGHSAYIFLNALLVRLNLGSEIALMRFFYSLSTVTLSIVVTFLIPTTLGFCLATGLGFLSGALVTIFRIRIMKLPFALPVGPNTHPKSEKVRKLIAVIIVQTGSSVTHQAFAIVTPFLGPYSVPWSVALRIANGLETLGGVIVGPLIDAEFVAHVARQELQKLRNVVQKAATLGTTLGMLGSLIVGILMATGEFGFERIWMQNPVLSVIAIACFVFGHVAIAPSGRIIYFLERHKLKVSLEASRFLFILLALATDNFEMRLVFLATGSMISGLATQIWLHYYKPSLGREVRHLS
jgi:hypothetical protein